MGPTSGGLRPIRVVLATAVGLILSCRPAEPDLEQILARHAEARGGAEALEAIHSLEVELRLTEPEFEADLRYRAMRPGMAAVEVFIDGRQVYAEAYDGATAWQRQGAAEPTPASPEGTAALRRGAIGNLYGLHELPGLGVRLEAMERTEIEGIRYHTVKATFADGFTRHFYLDPESFLITRQRETHALHPDADPTERWIESVSSDFRSVDGVLRSYRSTDRDLRTGAEVQAIEVRTIVHNPEIDPAIFEMPALAEPASEEPVG